MLRKRRSKPKKRTGCFSCKKAHVRCTEARPQCHRCVRLSLHCEYGLKLLWEDDAARRNIAHGRAGIWSRERGVQNQQPRLGVTNTGPIGSCGSNIEWTFLNLTPTDFRNDGFTEGDESESDEEAFPTDEPRVFESIEPVAFETETDLILDVEMDYSMVLGVSPGLYRGVNAHLLDYYVNELCPKCSLSPSYNPYLNILLPIAYEFAPLRNALLAAAANQLRLSNDHRFEASALALKSAAIRDLRLHLAAGPMDWKSLATIVMFCFYDISDDCAPSWVFHLRMGMSMLSDLETQTRTDDDLKRFCEIYFVTHDVMARTGLDDEEHVENYQWSGADHQEIDPLMGCSRELISIISEISSLATQSRADDASHLEITNRRNHIKTRLSELQQYPSIYTRDPQHLMQIAEAKRLAATLYLEQRVHIPSNFSITSSRSAGRRHLMDSIISTLSHLPVTSATSLWPLFVLGTSALETEDQRHFVLGRFHQLETARKLGNIHHAKRLVEQRMIDKSIASICIRGWKSDTVRKQLQNSERWISLA